MFSLVDRLSSALARLSAWLFFLIGGMIVYEVVARYVFTAPTVWAEEMSRFFQLWAVYIAAAAVLRDGGMIRITLFVDRLRGGPRRAAEVFSLLFVVLFSAVAAWYGAAIALDSWHLGRNTSTMLSVPQWMTEIVIPLGFALLAVQCLVEVARVALHRPAGPDGEA